MASEGSGVASVPSEDRRDEGTHPADTRIPEAKVSLKAPAGKSTWCTATVWCLSKHSPQTSLVSQNNGSHFVTLKSVWIFNLVNQLWNTNPLSLTASVLLGTIGFLVNSELGVWSIDWEAALNKWADFQVFSFPPNLIRGPPLTSSYSLKSWPHI